MRRTWPLALMALATVVMGGATPASGDAVGSATDSTTTATATVCGSSSLNGPTTPPSGAVVVPAGDNSGVDLRKANTTYYFETGTHTLGTDQYSQIMPGNGATFVGAPGAILDGQRRNLFAFTQQATGVTIRYLTITGFVAPHDQGVVEPRLRRRWVVEHNTIRDNAGAGLMAGATNKIRGNCLKDNGQYGLNAYQAGNTITGLVVGATSSPATTPRTGSTRSRGAGAPVAEVLGGERCRRHRQLGPRQPRAGGLADTNNNDFLIEDNLIEDNASLAIFYEISYNVVIRNNIIRRNAWASGAERAAGRGDLFPEAAIYLSEADGEPRVKARTSKIEITGNRLENNWGGITAWANADRFCNSPASTTGDCTLIVGPANTSQCSAPAIASEPLYTNCRWWTKNVDIHHNTFAFDPSAVNGGCPTAYCGHMALLSN